MRGERLRVRLREKEGERERERERKSSGQGMALTMLDLKMMLDEHLSFSFVDNLAPMSEITTVKKKRKRE